MSLINTNICGFENLGNTCYMNATLQALLSSDIMNTAIVKYINMNPKCFNNLHPLLIEYCRIIAKLSTFKTKMSDLSLRKTYNPLEFKETLDKENPYFSGFSQHDSNELMMYLLNEFADPKRDKNMSIIINKLCFGKYKQYINCLQCDEISENYFKFFDVLLPIPIPLNIKNTIDLEDCFKKFCEIDEIKDWDCPKCKKKVYAKKRMILDEVPKIVIMTLNRFKGMTKINIPIRVYPKIELDGINLKLIATINHYGGIIGGHYVAHISRYDNWYRADDSRITPIRLDTILNDESIYSVIYQIF